MRFNFLFFALGLILFSYGISIAIQVQYLGIHPWDVLNVALFDKFGLTIGMWNLAIGVLLVLVSLIVDRKYIRIGTIINAISIGPLIDLFLFIDVFPRSFSTVMDIAVLLLGIVLMGIGGGMYSAAGFGAGPRDGFMLSLSDKLGYSISRTRIAVESLVLIIGLLLGGPVFIFTLIYTFIQSPIFQFSFVRVTEFLKRTTKTNYSDEKVGSV
ncbi:hypothetical protein MUO14_06055 [Halobacillus shinanisalinarum]|uniref:Membrane protein YczE n=1 Tax=Halobacillus shinanisalinarum TaxID=2932258 RepID=A0ABY4H315_9BACI|nr:hypothetical protein [Halobacillus shinanisalinarum]UOQ94515.1 hypothetical protein MUO14_06055 [Halobacillus shinanisalinarum]